MIRNSEDNNYHLWGEITKHSVTRGAALQQRWVYYNNNNNNNSIFNWSRFHRFAAECYRVHLLRVWPWMLGNAEKLLWRKQWALWGTRGGSLLIITAECAAQTTALHSHHDGYNTLHLILNIFTASLAIYHAFWLHSIYRKSVTDLEHAKSFVYL